MPYHATLYYAMGEGLGSLTRASAVKHSLGLEELRIVTAEAVASKVFHSQELLKVPPTQLDPRSYQKWLEKRLKRYEFDAVYLDTFPAGLMGELNAWLPQWEDKLHYVARAMNMEAYASRLPETFPRLASTLILEELPPAQLAFIQAHSDEIRHLELGDPPVEIATSVQHLLGKLSAPIWLILHAGPAAEVDVLLQAARNLARQELATPSWLVCTQCDYRTPYRDVHVIDLYPATALTEFAEKVFTGCGFNTMRQLIGLGDKHLYLPFERRYDNQVARSERAEKK
ncbi:MAG: hypothetical protein AAF399_26000 [Bacteroidota bacterium]